jgi:hypothetical protein
MHILAHKPPQKPVRLTVIDERWLLAWAQS